MKRSCFFLLFTVLTALLTGCGAGSPPSIEATTSGRATFTVTWPARGRLIPEAANSIVIQIRNGNTIAASQTLSRPATGGTSSATFSLLPVGNLVASATAFPNADGTGVAQAQATAPLTIRANQNTSLALTMASTIDHLVVSPSPAIVQVGQSVPLTVTAIDATGAVVLITPAKLQWSAANATASVDADGNLTGLTNGTTMFTVTEQESGKSASVNVTVTQTYLINGVTYIPSTTQETLMATFTVPDGGVTVSSYQGYVLLNVTGVGQSYATVYNDAFYLYTAPFTIPTNGHDGGFYQLTFDTKTLTAGDVSRDAVNFLVNALPPYSPTHAYTFLLNTGVTTPSQLHFGVSDIGYSDDTGAYTITVTQLVPAP